MAERMMVFEPGEHLATMTTRGVVQHFEVDHDGTPVRRVPPPEGMPADVVEDVEASVRSILTDVVADRLVERVVEHVKSHLDEHARIVDAHYRTSPGTARLVDINFEPTEGSVFNWASKHPARTTGVRLAADAVRLIFEGEGGTHDRHSVSLAEHRETGRVTSE